MVRMQRTLIALAVGLAVTALPGVSLAQMKSDSKVKITAKASKPAADGVETVVVNLKIEKGWHIYANPVGNQDLAEVATHLAFESKGKVEVVKIAYPAGKVIKDKVVGDYNVYEDTIEVSAQVKRAKDDTGPFQVVVKIQACNDKACLLPSVVKIPTE